MKINTHTLRHHTHRGGREGERERERECNTYYNPVSTLTYFDDI